MMHGRRDDVADDDGGYGLKMEDGLVYNQRPMAAAVADMVSRFDAFLMEFPNRWVRK